MHNTTMANVNTSPWPLPSKVEQLSLQKFASKYSIDPSLVEKFPSFTVPFQQAGLAGYSDGAMRLIARQHGCPFCVTEALLDQTLLAGGKGRRREDPDLLQAECGLGDPNENRLAGLQDHPVAGQIIGSDSNTIAQAAEILVNMGYDAIDINLACPVKKIRKKKRGGHLLSNPSIAIQILKAVKKVVPKDFPLTVKMRRSFDDTNEMKNNFEKIFDAAYELNYSWVTVHTRTVSQKYLGPGHRPFLQYLVNKYPERIIFGSGDVWNVWEIFRMLRDTGVSAVSVARGCIGNPWIFQQACAMLKGQPPRNPSIYEQKRVLLDHFKLAATLHGEDVASRTMRKFGIKFASHHPKQEHVHKKFVKVNSTTEWKEVIKKYYLNELVTDETTSLPTS